MMHGYLATEPGIRSSNPLALRWFVANIEIIPSLPREEWILTTASSMKTRIKSSRLR